MTCHYMNISTYSRYNITDSRSDINFFVDEYKKRIVAELENSYNTGRGKFLYFTDYNFSGHSLKWKTDNQERFFKDTQNAATIRENYLSEYGFITCMIYTPSGEEVICGHSSGFIQMRHGSTGAVLCTLRNIQFPPKPIYSLEYSRHEERVCYAACMDGSIYRIEIPLIIAPLDEPPAFCIRADPAVECLQTQFYGTPGFSSYATPFITQRPAPLSLGLTADESKMAVGYADTSIKVFDMETQAPISTYKVHKLRLQFIPKKLQRMHFGQVCALKCHPEKENMFLTGSWDKTFRVWDVRCKVGCVMTFEGVDICSDSIDVNRDQAITGSWQVTEGLAVWDLVAKKRLNVIRVQNRRPDVDGEYIYACRYWRSNKFNRKGKYAIIGGSGTKCVEVINLHNRYITCSYPAAGTVLAIASSQERIAYGGTDTTFNIVNFYDPKHEKEKYLATVEPDFDYAHAPREFPDSEDEICVHEAIQTPTSKKSGVTIAADVKQSD